MRAAASSPAWPSSPAMTFGAQHADGLAQRRARHLQLLGQRAFVELGAGRDVAFDDELPQPRRDLLVQHGAGDRNDIGHGFAFCMQNASERTNEGPPA
jgi:hypothetical protein